MVGRNMGDGSVPTMTSLHSLFPPFPPPFPPSFLPPPTLHPPGSVTCSLELFQGERLLRLPEDVTPPVLLALPQRHHDTRTESK